MRPRFLLRLRRNDLERRLCAGYAVGITPMPDMFCFILRLRRDDLERRWCAAHSVGFPSRPGHAAYGGGRDANAYPPDRAAHFLIHDSLLRAETEGRIRRLRRCRRACATSPGIGVKPSFRLRSQSRYKSSRQRRSNKAWTRNGFAVTKGHERL